MMAFAVLRNGRPKMIGAFSLPHVSTTTKYIRVSNSHTDVFKDALWVAE
jgi:hypothetical protein